MSMKLKVLIIEDESIVALHIKKTVIVSGHSVVNIAKNSSEALEYAKNTRADLVISDINIDGDIDGIECCKILQSKYNIPVVFVTAYRDIETLRKASEVDFIGYLVKPFREDELETMINLVVLKYGFISEKAKYVINDIYSYCYKTGELFYNDNPVELTKKEQGLLLSLIEANGSVISYSTLEHSIWQGEQVGDGARRQLLYRFKQKAPNFPIKLLKGLGYKLEV
jgi:DNA-binding response OmpR family regulator